MTFSYRAAGESAAPMPACEGSPNVVVRRMLESLTQLADDPSLPRSARRAAQSAKDELAKPGTPQDVRIASAVGVLDDLANSPSLPTHGRTAIWSIMSNLESVQ
ncbi:MAG: UPF0147 family protein [Thermoplasmata archaeon]